MSTLIGGYSQMAVYDVAEEAAEVVKKFVRGLADSLFVVISMLYSLICWLPCKSSKVVVAYSVSDLGLFVFQTCLHGCIAGDPA